MEQAEQAKSTVTVADLDALIEKHNKLEDERDAIAEQVTAKNKEIAVVLGSITAHLKELGREDYDSPHGKCVIDQKWSVNLPKTDEEKAAFFAHLRERGLFEQMATVNSNSLNALYRKDWAEAEARGEAMTFTMPGIGAPKVFETTKIKRKK